MKRISLITDLLSGLRNRKGMNQRDFAKLLGLSQTQISFLESGLLRPSIRVLLKYKKIEWILKSESKTIDEIIEEMIA